MANVKTNVKARVEANGTATRVAAKIPPKKLALYSLLALVLLIVPVALQAATGYAFLVRILVVIGIWVLLALGLNIVVGYAGLLDLGYIAFYAMGGYAGVLIGQTVAGGLGGATYYVMLIPAALAGALTGVALGFPVLRLRGDYLAIVTLGFGEIVRILLTNDFLGLSNGATDCRAAPRSSHHLGRRRGWLTTSGFRPRLVTSNSARTSSGTSSCSH
jgi:ABC-type branched-subunit amino acid transport system permease subunit